MIISMQEKDEMASANPDLHFNSATVSLLLVLNFPGGMFKVLKLVYLLL